MPTINSLFISPKANNFPIIMSVFVCMRVLLRSLADSTWAEIISRVLITLIKLHNESLCMSVLGWKVNYPLRYSCEWRRPKEVKLQKGHRKVARLFMFTCKNEKIICNQSILFPQVNRMRNDSMPLTFINLIHTSIKLSYSTV